MTDINDTLIDALPDLTLVVRGDGVIVANVGGRHLGIAEEPGELVGTSLREIWTADIAEHLNLLVRRTLRTRKSVDRHYTYQNRHFEVRVQPKGVNRVLMVLRDVSSETGRAAIQPMMETAHSVALEHRAAFEQRLAAAITTCRLRELPLAIAAIHLGGLRDARNLLGSPRCSRLLSNVLTRLQAAPPLPGDAGPYTSPFGRIRGDLLVVMFFGMRDRKTITEAAERIRRGLAEPLVDGDNTAQLRPTVGVARFPDDGAAAQGLMESARVALAAARQSENDSTIRFCSRTLNIPMVNLPDFEQELRWALERAQLVLHYQPVMELKTGRTLSFEALIRWVHPVCGEMIPEQFLHVAEHSQLGTEIDEWALGRACNDLRRLTLSRDTTLRIAVNIGRRMLEADHITDRLARCADSAGIELCRLDININERIMSTAGAALDRLRDLRARGVRVYVDGFGTGRISLDRLASLPIDGIGIDRGSIGSIEHDAAARAMCRSVVSIARAFEMRSIAVGVETEQQREFLLEIGCDAAQGRLFGAPSALDDSDPPLSRSATESSDSPPSRPAIEGSDSLLSRPAIEGSNPTPIKKPTVRI